MELGGDPDRREEAERALNARTRKLGAALAAAVFVTVPALPAIPAAEASGACTLARIAEWKLRPTRAQPILDGSINGRKIGIVLDTGASRSIVLRSAADRLGLVRYDARGHQMLGIGGETAVETVSIDELAIGGDVRRNWRALVAGEHGFGSDIALILGEDFFQQIDVEFDLAHDTVRLFQARDCDGKSLAYWTADGAGVVELESGAGAGPSIELGVEINGRPARAMLDSGAFSSVVTKAHAAALGVTPESAGVVAAGCTAGLGEKTIDVWFGPFESFRIGNELIRDPRIRFADIWKFFRYKGGSLVSSRPAALPDMLLGADFLRSHRVLVAHSQRKVYFTHAGGTVFPVSASKACADAQSAGPSTK